MEPDREPVMSGTRPAPPAHTALVTGANRGIGLELARRLARERMRVVLTARDRDEAQRAAEMLREEGLDVRAEPLDVSREADVEACAQRLRRAGERIDVLINNAGVYPSGGVLDTSPERFRETFDVNFFGALWCCRAFVPAMLRAGYGRVVNVSTGYGSFAEGLKGPAAYSISKAALNALTLRLARDLRGDVKVNSVCPGWVRTRMGGPGATTSVEEAADSIVWLATLLADGPSGGFFRERERIAW